MHACGQPRDRALEHLHRVAGGHPHPAESPTYLSEGKDEKKVPLARRRSGDGLALHGVARLGWSGRGESLHLGVNGQVRRFEGPHLRACSVDGALGDADAVDVG